MAGNGEKMTPPRKRARTAHQNGRHGGAEKRNAVARGDQEAAAADASKRTVYNVLRSDKNARQNGI